MAKVRQGSPKEASVGAIAEYTYRSIMYSIQPWKGS